MAEPQQTTEQVATPSGKPLDRAAIKGLKRLRVEMQLALLAEADKISADSRITDDDLYRAHLPCSRPR